VGRAASKEVHAQRRQRVRDRLGDGVLVVGAGHAPVRSRDTHYPFRPGSDFYYLTGLAEPEGVLVLGAFEGGEMLFVRPRDAEAEVWDGRRPGPEGARARTGIEKVASVRDLADRLPSLLDGHRLVYAPLVPGDPILAAVLRAIEVLRRQERSGRRAPATVADPYGPLGEERLRKDAAALSALRTAVAITVEAHDRALAAARPGGHEYQIQAALEGAFRAAGAAGPAYGSIVAAGDNATILHYVENDGPLRTGELLLVDAGAEYDGMAADLTRTYPLDGRFRPAQRDLYEVVLRANEAGIAAVRPGATLPEIHDRVVRVLAEGLVDLGLCEGPVDAVVETKAYRRFYMHRTSHFLGADVHDVGSYRLADGTPRPLEPTFVITVEPGLYVPAGDDSIPAELAGTGIRIEDDVLVTADGHEVLTAAAPKAVSEVEAQVARARAARS